MQGCRRRFNSIKQLVRICTSPRVRSSLRAQLLQQATVAGSRPAWRRDWMQCRLASTSSGMTAGSGLHRNATGFNIADPFQVAVDALEAATCSVADIEAVYTITHVRHGWGVDQKKQFLAALVDLIGQCFSIAVSSTRKGASPGTISRAAASLLDGASGREYERRKQLDDDSSKAVYDLLAAPSTSDTVLALLSDEHVATLFTSPDSRAQLAAVVSRLNEDVRLAGKVEQENQEMEKERQEREKERQERVKERQERETERWNADPFADMKRLEETGIATLEQLQSSQVETWSRTSVDAICQRVESQLGVDFNGTDGSVGRSKGADATSSWNSRAPVYQGKALREYLMQKGSLDDVTNARAAAENLLEAVSVLQHADFMTASPDNRPVRTVLTGHPGSKREGVALSTIQILIEYIKGTRKHHFNRCRVIAGSRGIGKTQIMRCIGQAAAILDFANEGVRVIPAFVSQAAPMTPLSHMAAACLKTGVLLDDQGKLPAWADSMQPGVNRGITFMKWCKAHRMHPVLLIDEITVYGDQRVLFEREVVQQLNELSEEYMANGIVRLSGSWSRTAAYMFRGNKFHDHKISPEPITNGMPVVEAAHMIGHFDLNSASGASISIQSFVAQQLLEGKTPTVEAAGYVTLDRHAPVQPSFRLMTRDDALQLKKAIPDWDKQVRAGEALVSDAEYLSGGIPRFLIVALDGDKFNDAVLKQLLYKFRTDPGASLFFGWLVGATLEEHPDILQDSIEAFHERWVPVNQECLKEAIEKNRLSNRKDVPKYEAGDDLLELLTSHGIIQVRRDPPREGLEQVQFSSPLLLSVANQLMRGVGNLLHTLEMMALQRPDGFYGRIVIENLVAEGLALHGLDQLVDGLRGTLACRVLDCDVSFEASSSRVVDRDEDGDESSLDQSSIASSNGSSPGGGEPASPRVQLPKLPLSKLFKNKTPVEVPVNTVMVEKPDRRKCDLVAVCIAPGSKVAYVIRAQVKAARSDEIQLTDATLLRDSWDKPIPTSTKKGVHAPVLDALKNAANLQHIEEWHHVPVWLSATTPKDKYEIEEAGIRVISGRDFWEFGIPHLQAVAWTLVGKQARTPSDAELRKLIDWERPGPGESYVADVRPADGVHLCEESGS